MEVFNITKYFAESKIETLNINFNYEKKALNQATIDSISDS